MTRSHGIEENNASLDSNLLQNSFLKAWPCVSLEHRGSKAWFPTGTLPPTVLIKASVNLVHVTSGPARTCSQAPPRVSPLP